MPIPIIDERIKHVGPATLRKYDALKLRGLRELIVIQDGDEPLAVLIPYEMYLEMQKEVTEGAAANSLDIFAPGFGAAAHVLPEINPDDYGKMPAGAPVTIDDGIEQPNGGVNQNPDMAYSKDSYIEPSIERRQVPRSGLTVDVPTRTPIDQIHENDSGWLPPKPLDPKNMDTATIVGTQQWCQHCGNPATSTLCQECFLAGHRAVANCRQCAEVSKE